MIRSRNGSRRGGVGSPVLPLSLCSHFFLMAFPANFAFLSYPHSPSAYPPLSSDISGSATDKEEFKRIINSDDIYLVSYNSFYHFINVSIVRMLIQQKHHYKVENKKDHINFLKFLDWVRANINIHNWLDLTILFTVESSSFRIEK